jgi:hypothetical protein
VFYNQIFGHKNPSTLLAYFLTLKILSLSFSKGRNLCYSLYPVDDGGLQKVTRNFHFFLPQKIKDIKKAV